jgi:protein TonB
MIRQIGLSTAILVALLSSLPAFAQTNNSARPRHCSVESVAKGSPSLPYPDSLKGSGIQGTVLLEAMVDTSGCAHDVRVIRKLHPKLDKLAKDTVNSWKFSPATKDGKPVMVIIQIEVEFKDSGK